MKYKRVIFLFIITVLIVGCMNRSVVNDSDVNGLTMRNKHSEDKSDLLNFLQGAEIQYESVEQERNIVRALKDVLSLPEDQLKKQKYMDYSGNKEEWDLPTLISRHFVPERKGASLGNNFYKEITTVEVKNKIKKMLEELENRSSDNLSNPSLD